MAATTLPPPNFLIVGAKRSGTRWLRYNLNLHPEIYAPPVYWGHDGGFFDQDDCLEPGRVLEYRRRFSAGSDVPFVGDCSPNYMRWIPENPFVIPSRIGRVLRDVRIIAIVRNPLERIESAVRDRMRRGLLPIPFDMRALSVLSLDDGNHPVLDRLLAETAYARTLARLEERIGERPLVLFHDDLATQPEKVYEAALRHIGASTDFVPPDLATPRFVTPPLPGDTPFPTFPLDLARSFYVWLRNDIGDLEAMTGRDLSAWDPGHPSEG